ncbi:hypothetical protein CTAYLR_002019 [Chrysophaeum taylorii]|uniref:Methyltransferase domain-containing protein n=1 Tax=Chrysophaeum taylorii TaxID=2483200 RepID=A0AAD7XMV5_9STRA|nr:hypothetical protein CTAYLR_002019 [Chrysophaeum taylorii]
MTSSASPPMLFVAFAAGGVVALALERWWKNTKTRRGDVEEAQNMVWGAISGAMAASQLYVGDRLDLYSALRELGGKTTALELASKTKLNVRWLREWLAQQASFGVLTLAPGRGDEDANLAYAFATPAMAEVLADPESPAYDISLVQMVPSLVNRAKTMLPEAFRTGRGVAYDDKDVTEAIDRAHVKHIRDVVLPRVFPAANGTSLLSMAGARCADLGCGAGNFLLALARAFPRAAFDGYEVSDVPLAQCVHNIRASKLGNVAVKDARQHPLGDTRDLYDVVTTYDVLHDAPNPAELARQVKNALKPNGVWILGDIAALDSTRANITNNPRAATYFAFSTCLCMACALSEPGGAGLGTLGFTIPVAMDILTTAGFTKVKVVLEQQNMRWFAVSH